MIPVFEVARVHQYRIPVADPISRRALRMVQGKRLHAQLTKGDWFPAYLAEMHIRLQQLEIDGKVRCGHLSAKNITQMSVRMARVKSDVVVR